MIEPQKVDLGIYFIHNVFMLYENLREDIQIAGTVYKGI